MNRKAFFRGGACAFALAANPFPARCEVNVKPAGKRISVAIASKNLQWLRTPEEVAKAAIEMGFSAVLLSAGPAPAHVTWGDRNGLREFINRLRAQGVAVDTIDCPADLTADTLELSNVLEAAASAGIAQYTFGPYPYLTDQPINLQTQKFKTRLAALARLNASLNIRGLYRNRAGLYQGALMFDLLGALDGLDPHAIGIGYDSGQGALAGGDGSWIAALQAVASFLGAVICTDNTLQLQIDADQGGPFTGVPPQHAVYSSNTVARPYGGGGGRANPWIAPCVPLGTGLVDLPRLGSTLKAMGFDGPLIIQSDYPNGGAENGGEILSLPKARVLGTIKRDLLTLKAGLAAGGFA